MRTYRTENQRSDYVKAHLISDEEAAEHDNRSASLEEGVSLFLAVVLALIGAVQYWIG